MSKIILNALDLEFFSSADQQIFLTLSKGVHMAPDLRIFISFSDFLENKSFFSHGYDGKVCVGGIIVVAWTIQLDSDLLLIYLGVSGAIWPQKQG